MMAEILIRNTSEFLALLCIAGLAACLARWPTSRRRAYLLAFGAFLGGTLMREAAVWFYGPTGWPVEALYLSAAGRAAQIFGSMLFVRAALRDYCGEWGWIAIVAAAAIGAMVV